MRWSVAPISLAIHIFSHGGKGRVTLGSFALTTGQLDNRSADLSRLGASLTRTGDLMLYGSDVAADFAGQRVVAIECGAHCPTGRFGVTITDAFSPDIIEPTRSIPFRRRFSEYCP